MKALYYITFSFCFCALMVCCERKQPAASSLLGDDLIEQPLDTTTYGICGEKTTPSRIQLITDLNDTLFIKVSDEGASNIVGGIIVGDRLALTYRHSPHDDLILDQCINITSLLGRWKSIDRQFEICEGGVVAGDSLAGQKAWTKWTLLNGRLLLNKDTFTIASLGADSLELETPTEIFLYTR